MSKQPKVSINLLHWNTPLDEVSTCVRAVLSSNFDDYELVYTENADAGAPTLIEAVLREFGNDPHLRIVDNKQNLGYAGGHNGFFAVTPSELLMVLNPDAILHKDFLRHIVEAFDNPAVGAATGKMIKPDAIYGGGVTLDGTGIVMNRNRRAFERGQLELDSGQYDSETTVFAVSGTAAVYRRSALESIRIGHDEYFDTDFFAYWEDLDLSWRLRLQGFECVYVPTAVVRHERAVGISTTGLHNLTRYVRHRHRIPSKIRRWSWRNHLFAILKNDFGWGFYRDLPWLVTREVAMLGFIIVFSPSTLLAVPDFIRMLPRMLRKRRLIQSKRAVSSAEIYHLFGRD